MTSGIAEAMNRLHAWQATPPSLALYASHNVHTIDFFACQT